ncbi:MAG: DeoR/GlpR family DNA-binding transcription regulator [Anaerolineae bacterium]|jgi:DeoR family transcriptional regulator of aga operon|nr:DeoR/GlpR transcriptional regulator [Chloroflexota bacterium]
MARRPYRQERLVFILERLYSTGYVSVTELAQSLGVSSVTVRSDLDSLAAEGHLQRTHGGAVLHQTPDDLSSFSARQKERSDVKERIGIAAASLVEDGEAIILDASTTSWYLARKLVGHRDLTVLTNGLHVAIELMRGPGITVLMPGGRVWREAGAVIDPLGNSIPEDTNFGKVFYSGGGFSLQAGLSDPNRDEAHLKHTLLGQDRMLTVMVDSSKFGKVALATSAPIERIARLVTDSGAPQGAVEELRQRGIEVIIV